MKVRSTNAEASRKDADAAGQPGQAMETNDDRFIRRPEVLRLTGVGKTTWDTLMRDGGAPRGTAITPKILVWSKAEIQAWMKARLSERARAQAPTHAGPAGASEPNPTECPDGQRKDRS